MSGSVWYISFSNKKIEFKKYPKKKKLKKIIKKQRKNYKKVLANFLLAFSLVIFLGVISSAQINDTLHINLQTTYSNGTIQSGTFTFAFNITENSSSSCSGPIVYNHSVSETTDTRGIVSIYLPTNGSGGGNLSELDFDKQYYLCYYRDGTLKDVSQLGRVPYSFRATQVNLSEISVDSNLNMTDFNITNVDTGFFSFLGSVADRITGLFVQDINASGNTKISGNLSVDTDTLFVNSNTDRVGIGTTGPSYPLDVAGSGDLSVRVGNTTTDSTTLIIDTKNSGTSAISLRRQGAEVLNLYANGGSGKEGFDFHNAFQFLYDGNNYIDFSRPSEGVMLISGGRSYSSGYGNDLVIQGGITNNYPAGDLILRGGNATGTGTTGDIIIQDPTGAVEYARIVNDTGYVGINTTTPQNTLNVAGDANATGLIYADEFSGSINWTNLQNYPAACEAGKAVQVIGDTLTCINISAQGSDTLDGYDSSFFMPLNTSVSGDFDFNGGWTEGGFSISGGDIYAQTVYVYNITSLSVSNLNINGSLFPQEGYDNTFDIGNSTLRWRDLYLGGEIASNGTGDNYFLGNVGIGTASPQDKLDISSGGAIRLRSDGTDSEVMKFYDSATKVHVISANYSGSGSTGNDLIISSDQSANILTLERGGNVGINTTTPQNTLNVAGTFNATGDWYSAGTTIVTGNLLEADSLTQNDVDSSEIAADAVSDSELDGGFGWTLDTDLNIDSNTLVVSYDDNRVGIGLTDPSEELEVTGDIQLSGGADRAIYVGSEGVGDADGKDLTVRGGTGYGGFSTGGDLNLSGGIGAIGGNVYITGYDGISGYGDVIIAESVGYVGIGIASPSSLLTTGVSSGTNEVNLSGVLYVNSTSGKVGIGTSKPTSTLAVGGTGNSAYAISGEGLSYGVYGDGTSYGVYGHSDGAGVRGSGGTTGVYAAGTTYDFYAATGSAKNFFAGSVGIGTTNINEKLVVVGDGNFTGTLYADGVGINTSSPDYKLDVVGEVIIHPDETWSSGDVASLYLGAAASGYIKNTYGTGMEIFVGDNMQFTKANAAADYFYWKHAGGTTLMTLDNSGGLNVTGELMGSRQSFPFGEATSHGAAQSFYLETVSAVTSSATKGYVMHRAGSIVGASIEATCTNVLGGNANVEVRKNGTAVYTITLSTLSDGEKSAYGTQARGTDTFSAGDVIAIYYNYGTADWDIDDIVAYVEVVFDT